jgi:hypothetical protein
MYQKEIQLKLQNKHVNSIMMAINPILIDFVYSVFGIFFNFLDYRDLLFFIYVGISPIISIISHKIYLHITK